jgi:NAD(P)-dependent dehydrogenase (short-subunit alcohol dehydrogenase family)
LNTLRPNDLTAHSASADTLPRRALIVGGTRGIGRVLADRWAAAGKSVSVIARTPPERTEPLPMWHFWSADLCATAELRAILKELCATSGTPDEVVYFQRARGATDDWDAELATTLTGTQTILEALSPQWSAARRPSVVMVGSLAARQVAREQGPAYHVAKAGLEQLMRYYAATWGPRGIRVNAVIPGIVMKESSRVYYEEHPAVLAAYQQVIPLGRLATPDDVCDAIDFLCSPQASYLTGQSLGVDGGLSLPMAHYANRPSEDRSATPGERVSPVEPPPSP